VSENPLDYLDLHIALLAEKLESIESRISGVSSSLDRIADALEAMLEKGE